MIRDRATDYCGICPTCVYSLPQLEWWIMNIIHMHCACTQFSLTCKWPTYRVEKGVGKGGWKLQPDTYVMVIEMAHRGIKHFGFQVCLHIPSISLFLPISFPFSLSLFLSLLLCASSCIPTPSRALNYPIMHSALNFPQGRSGRERKRDGDRRVGRERKYCWKFVT